MIAFGTRCTNGKIAVRRKRDPKKLKKWMVEINCDLLFHTIFVCN